MGGGRPDSDAIYQGMKAARGTAYTQDDAAEVNLELQAVAHTIARAKAYQTSVAWQAFVEESTTTIPHWERIYGVTPAPTDTESDRRALLYAIEQGQGELTEETIVAAVEQAIGETGVTIVTSRAPLRTTLSPAPTDEDPPDVSVITGGGRLAAGDHHVFFSCHNGSQLRATSGAAFTILGTGDAILAGPVTVPAGSTRVDWYVSTAAYAGSLAYVASNNGGAIVLANYPRNLAIGGLCHHAIVVSASAAADSTKRAKIHRVLGAWLPAEVTFDIVSESPFLLGLSSLGTGSF